MNILSNLSEVADVFNGKTPSTSDQRDKGFPVLKIRDVNDEGVFRGKFESFVDEAYAQKFRDRWINTSDILILNAAHNASYVASKVFRATDEVAGSLGTGEWLFVRPRTAEPSYVYHYLRTAQARLALRELVKGIHLYPKDVGRIRVPLPPLAEQQRIAAILDQADELRRIRRQALTRWETLPLAFFYEMFGEPVTNSRGLKSKSLGQVAEFVSGGTPDKARAEFWGGQIPWVSPKDMKRLYVSSSIDCVTDKAFSESNLKRIEPGTPLIVVRGMILAHTVPMALACTELAINQDIKAIRFDDPIIPEFGLWCLKAQHDSILGRVDTAAHGTKRLDTDRLRSIPIFLASIEEQKQFLAAVDRWNRLVDNSMQQLSKLDALFASLQHHAFRGEL